MTTPIESQTCSITRSSVPSSLPSWAPDLLAHPDGHSPVQVAGAAVVTAAGEPIAAIEDGVVCFPLPGDDPSINFYQAVDGPHFHERAAEPFAMSTLDTTVYHHLLKAMDPVDPLVPVVDVGGGDGRNALPWLRRDHQRVVIVDASAGALRRFRTRVAAENPSWLDRLLLVRADMRTLPLATGVVGRVQAIESLYYLNDDYEQGLAECVRILGTGGRVLVSERDYEAGLLVRLFYFGNLAGLLQQADSRDVWDGNARTQVRTRCFTASELAEIIGRHGLRITARYGIPGLSLILGYLRGTGALNTNPDHLPALQALLLRLSETGSFSRCHVVVAEKMSS